MRRIIDGLSIVRGSDLPVPPVTSVMYNVQPELVFHELGESEVK